MTSILQSDIQSDTTARSSAHQTPAASSAEGNDGDQRPLLKVVVVGSVDDGKSTLLGRLLYECDGLYEDQIAAVRQRSKGEALDLSLFTDGLLAEREQGITIDVAWRYLQTPELKLVLADTPGHVQYTRNMATGASTAEAVIILVDARLGLLQQTRRHAKIAALLGIPNVCVAINKIDLVDDAAATYAALHAEVTALVAQLGFVDVAIIPVSAVVGDNITRPGTLTPFYDGPTVLSWLGSVPARLAAHRQQRDGAFRFPVQTVLRPNLDYRGYAGPVVAGEVRVGDEVVILPAGTTSRIAGIDTFNGPVARAQAPQAVVLRLADDVDVSRGDLIASRLHAPKVVRRFAADVVWFAESALALEAPLVLKHTTRAVRARITRLAHKLDLDTLEIIDDAIGATGNTRPLTLQQNDIGRIHLETARAITADRYDDDRDVGAFILVDPVSNDTVAAGMIRSFDDDDLEERADDQAIALRTARFGHAGAAVLASPAQAANLERQLLNAGLVATLARTVEAAIVLASAGVIAVVSAGPERHRLLQERFAEAGLAVHVHVDVPDAGDDSGALDLVGRLKASTAALAVALEGTP